MKKILVLSFYYPPDIGPGPLRAKSIIDALSRESKDDVEITIMTTVPNRYKATSVSASENEKDGNNKIYRASLPSHKSGIFYQVQCFYIFFRFVQKNLNNYHCDIVVATSSRLMTAVLGAYVAKKLHAKLFLDIRDLFVDTLRDVLPKLVSFFILPAFRILERWTFRSASSINIVSAGFLPYVKKIAPIIDISTYTNGIDADFIEYKYSCLKKEELPLVLYAGNIGDGQGLHHIIPSIAKLMEGQCRFRVVGSGSRKRELENMLDKLNVVNVELFEPVSRKDLFAHYSQAKILFLHLNNFKAFEKVLPSKIFEYAATGKHIVAGVSGYAANFLREEIPDVEIFNPCDTFNMKLCLDRILVSATEVNRKNFCERYARETIMQQVAKKIITIK
jgi:hypothetical protein